MYGSPPVAHRFVWRLRRALHLSPTQKLFRQLQKNGIALDQMDALEMFGADGMVHTLDYYPLVRSLEIWELKEQYLAGLLRNFPKSSIKITDSFNEIQVTQGTYNLLVADGPCNVIGPNQEYCEHFELLTQLLFRVARPTSVIILTVVPDPIKHIPAIGETPTYSEYLERRGAFYGTNRPQLIPVEEMVPAYRRVVEANGFKLDWHVLLRRTIRTGVYYLALAVSRVHNSDCP